MNKELKYKVGDIVLWQHYKGSKDILESEIVEIMHLNYSSYRVVNNQGEVQFLSEGNIIGLSNGLPPTMIIEHLREEIKLKEELEYERKIEA